MFTTTGIAKGNLALLAIEYLINFVRPHRLIPISIILVVGFLVKTLRSVSVEKRPAKSHALD